MDAHIELSKLEEADLTISITIHLLEVVFASSLEVSQIHSSLDLRRIRVNDGSLLILLIITRLILLFLEVGESFTQPRILPEFSPVDCLVLTHIEQVESSFPLARVRPPERGVQMHFQV